MSRVGRAPGRKPAASRVESLADLGLMRRALRERERQAAEAARRAAEEEAAKQRERDLFVRSVGPVIPLTRPVRLVHHRPRPAPVPRQRLLDDARVLRESLSDEFDPATLIDTDEQLAWGRPGVGPEVLRKLRRGVWVVQGHLDLHGHTRVEARLALVAFLQEAGSQGWRCVRVVHGKGLGSPGREPVLKHKVRSWLVQRQEVLAFALARGDDGGAGALIVLLDSARR
ncbi:MAG: Smr/MutS family protein [Burkholderiales bacterium]